MYGIVRRAFPAGQAGVRHRGAGGQGGRDHSANHPKDIQLHGRGARGRKAAGNVQAADGREQGRAEEAGPGAHQK